MSNKEFETIISHKVKSPFFDLSEILKYKDLIFLWIKRDWVASYKQTLVGPAWSVIQPIVSTVIYTFVFGNIAKLSPTGIPMFLFFMAGQIIWTFFSNSFQSIATAYIDNAYIWIFL